MKGEGVPGEMARSKAQRQEEAYHGLRVREMLKKQQMWLR